MIDIFEGKDMFGNLVTAHRGNNGSMIVAVHPVGDFEDDDDDENEYPPITIHADSMPAFSKWIEQTNPSEARP